MGQEYESSQFWFYFLYPFVVFSRLALIVYSYSWSFFVDGSCIWFDALLSSVISWLWYLFGLALWHIIFIVLSGVELWLQPMTLFFMDHCRSASRKACCLSRPLEYSKIILALDCRLMVLSEFMSYSWWSCFVASYGRWSSSFLSGVCLLKQCLSLP